MIHIAHSTGPPRKRQAQKGEAEMRLDPQIGFCDHQPFAEVSQS